MVTKNDHIHNACNGVQLSSFAGTTQIDATIYLNLVNTMTDFGISVPSSDMGDITEDTYWHVYLYLSLRSIRRFIVRKTGLRLPLIKISGGISYSRLDQYADTFGRALPDWLVYKELIVAWRALYQEVTLRMLTRVEAV